MLVLLTNDDGIQAPGLKALKEALAGLGDLRVAAPDRDQSGISHAFTVRGPYEVNEIHNNGSLFGWAVRGTPVDAVKVAVRALLPRMPDLVVSGINGGENSGVDLLYSGTVAAAMEAATYGVPAIAVSLASRSYDDFSAAAAFTRRIVSEALQRGMPPGVVLNVNVPPLAAELIHGVRVTRQGDSYYEESLEQRDDGDGLKYHWTRWGKQMAEDGEGSDVKAIRDGFISVTPIRARLTDNAFMPALERWRLTDQPRR